MSDFTHPHVTEAYIRGRRKDLAYYNGQIALYRNFAELAQADIESAERLLSCSRSQGADERALGRAAALPGLNPNPTSPEAKP